MDGCIEEGYTYTGYYEEKDELYQDDMKKSINSNRPCAVVPNSWRGKEFNKLCPPNSSDDLCHFFCMNPSSMITGVDCGVKKGRKGGGFTRHLRQMQRLRIVFQSFLSYSIHIPRGGSTLECRVQRVQVIMQEAVVSENSAALFNP